MIIKDIQSSGNSGKVLSKKSISSESSKASSWSRFPVWLPLGIELKLRLKNLMRYSANFLSSVISKLSILLFSFKFIEVLMTKCHLGLKITQNLACIRKNLIASSPNNEVKVAQCPGCLVLKLRSMINLAEFILLSRKKAKVFSKSALAAVQAAIKMLDFPARLSICSMTSITENWPLVRPNISAFFFKSPIYASALAVEKKRFRIFRGFLL